MYSEDNYEKAVMTTNAQIEKSVIVIKPYLINLICYGNRDIDERAANDIIKRMVSEKSIDEHLALSKMGKPYAFYTMTTGKFSIAKALEPVRSALNDKKELSLNELSAITSYSSLTSRVLLTHLVLMGEVDYSGNLESPVFYVPWEIEK